MSETTPRLCTDRILDSAEIRRLPPKKAQLRLGLPLEKKWTNGRALHVAFLDGATLLHDRVATVAATWVERTSLTMEFGSPTAESDIRISFETPGSWSYIGTDARRVTPDLPTMSLGWLTTATSHSELRQAVLHEFGHALGAVHEHQNPSGGIEWDRNAVYTLYALPPNRWSRDEVDRNIFARYDADVTQFSAFDTDSIMIYAIPNALTLGDFAVSWNGELSPTDQEWITVAYPNRPPSEVELALDGHPREGTIGAHGEWDEYRFVITKRGRFAVETYGPTDVTIALAGPDDPELVIAEDDDSGRDHNARIEAGLEAGTYMVRVWHHWPTGAGTYRLSLRTTS